MAIPRNKSTNVAVDFRGNPMAPSTTDPSVTADLNPEEDLARSCGTVQNEVHQGHADWGWAPGRTYFTYRFQCTPFFADGIASFDNVAYSELSLAQAKAAHVDLPPLTVTISVRSGCGAKWIAPSSPLEVPVVIFGSAEIDVSKIDVGSLRLGDAPATSTAISNVNADAYPDMTAMFQMNQIGVTAHQTSVDLGASLQSSQLFFGVDTISVVPAAGPTVATKADDYYEEDPDFKALDKTLRACTDPPVLNFKLSDCVATTVDNCGIALDPNIAGKIDRIELWPTIEAKDAADPRHAAEAIRHARERIDQNGCPKWAIYGSSATLPYEELDDIDGNTGFYMVYFTVKDATYGGTTSGSCRVNLFKSRKEQAELAGEPANEQPVPGGCAVCLGTGCAPGCAPPAVACAHSFDKCAKARQQCQTKGHCDDYNRTCTTVCGAH